MSDVEWERRLGSIIQGRYRLESFLARGGMGAVFLCEDLRLTGRRWALKEMLISNPQQASLIEDSFQRETEMLARLRHESLPIVVDSFVEEFRRYVVMEYMEGETLAQKVARDGPINQTQAVRWITQLSQVLTYLHSQNPPIIFHDLKPENIIITQAGLLKLVDFGLAGQVGRDQLACGTVGYAAPEQWEEGQHTDQRSDVFGAGATLFFLLTGHPPLYGSQRLRQYCPQVESDLEAIIVRCLHADPGLRYPDCQGLTHDLESWSARHGAAQTKAKQPLSLLGTAAVICLAAALLWLGLKSPSPTTSPTPSGIDQVLNQTAEAKARARAAIADARYPQATTILDDLLRRHPQDGEAQILKNNTAALLQGGACLHIPVLSSVSGTEYEGIQMLQGLALAQRELNQKGLVDAAQANTGKQSILLDFFDCRSQQSVSLEWAIKLAADPAVQIVIGPWTSQQALAIAPILEGAGLPIISPVASDPRMWNAGNNTFTAADSDRGRLLATARYFAGQGRRRAAIAYNADNVVSQTAAQDFKEIFSSLGGETVAEVSYLENARDFGEALRQMGRAKPDFIFMAEYRSDAMIAFSRQMHAQKIDVPLGTQSSYSDTLIRQGGRDLQGMVTASYFYPEAPSPAIVDFSKRFEELCGGLHPSHRQANSYDTLMLLAKAIETCGFKRGPLRDYLESLGAARPPYSGVTGEFSPSRRLDRRKSYLLEIRDGKYALLKD